LDESFTDDFHSYEGSESIITDVPVETAPESIITDIPASEPTHRESEINTDIQEVSASEKFHTPSTSASGSTGSSLQAVMTKLQKLQSKIDSSQLTRKQRQLEMSKELALDLVQQQKQKKALEGKLKREMVQINNLLDQALNENVSLSIESLGDLECVDAAKDDLVDKIVSPAETSVMEMESEVVESALDADDDGTSIVTEIDADSVRSLDDIAEDFPIGSPGLPSRHAIADAGTRDDDCTPPPEIDTLDNLRSNTPVDATRVEQVESPPIDDLYLRKSTTIEGLSAVVQSPDRTESPALSDGSAETTSTFSMNTLASDEGAFLNFVFYGSDGSGASYDLPHQGFADTS
jgi:hypothetical protein